MWQRYIQPTSLEDVLTFLHFYQKRARLLAGGTDLLVEQRHHDHPVEILLDISRVQELKYLHVTDEHAETLGLPLGKVSLLSDDSHETPNAGSASASRREQL